MQKSGQKPKISLITAMGRNRELGKNNALLWTIPDDLKRFKTITLGHPIIMGRKTYESIFDMLGKPLPKRHSIVLMREAEFNPDETLFKYENVSVAFSPERAIEKASALDSQEIFIGGGAQIYALFLPQVDRLYLTLIDASKDADAFFPEYEHSFTKKLSEESGEFDGLKYRFVVLER